MATGRRGGRTHKMTDTQTVNSINVSQEHRIAADRATLFTDLTTRVGNWRRHPFCLFEGDAEVRLEPRPGGTLGAYWNDGFAVWGPSRSLCRIPRVRCSAPGHARRHRRPALVPPEVRGWYDRASFSGSGDWRIRYVHQQHFEHGWNMTLGNLKGRFEQASDGDWPGVAADGRGGPRDRGVTPSTWTASRATQVDPALGSALGHRDPVRRDRQAHRVPGVLGWFAPDGSSAARRLSPVHVVQHVTTLVAERRRCRCVSSQTISGRTSSYPWTRRRLMPISRGASGK